MDEHEAAILKDLLGTDPEKDRGYVIWPGPVDAANSALLTPESIRNAMEEHYRRQIALLREQTNQALRFLEVVPRQFRGHPLVVKIAGYIAAGIAVHPEQVKRWSEELRVVMESDPGVD